MMDEKKLSNNNASKLMMSEDETDPDSNKRFFKRVRLSTKILCGIIVIISFSLIGVIRLYQNSNRQLLQKTSTLKWLAFQHRNVREENEYYKKFMENQDYLEFIRKIYEQKDKDFFETATIAYNEAKKAEINPFLIMSIIHKESAFNQYIVSQITVTDENGLPKRVPCAYGLMQINYNAWKEDTDLNLDVNKIYDKQYNIEKGIYIYKYYLKIANGNYWQALYFYNNGTDPKNPNTAYSGNVMGSKFMKLVSNNDIFNKKLIVQ